jgi:hypothetical protein
MRRTIAAVLLLLLLGVDHARAVPVDVELILAVDVSRSIDEEEAKLQRQGYLAALTDKEVVAAIRNGPVGRIALTYIEWAGVMYQRTIIPWTVVGDMASATAFAAHLASSPIVAENWTSISAALDHTALLFDDNGFEGTRLVIDVSGDGRNNQGRPAADARDAAVRKGIIINGLPIMNDRLNVGRPPEKDLDLYYRDNVIGGPGAFLIVAENFAHFAQAIRSKMMREISGDPVWLADATGSHQ